MYVNSVNMPTKRGEGPGALLSPQMPCMVVIETFERQRPHGRLCGGTNESRAESPAKR